MISAIPVDDIISALHVLLWVLGGGIVSFIFSLFLSAIIQRGRRK